MKVLVTGGSGQLGQALQAADKEGLEFVFLSSAQADITDKALMLELFATHKPDFCINAAAYTAVDKAEAEADRAYAINCTGAANLAAACNANHCTLLHISTDFVFDGTKGTPYTEDDVPNPQSVYGTTKLQGEQEVQKLLKEHFIIRTSWVYSQYGHNFMKTMLRLASERDTLSVVNDQQGTPTNANNLAAVLIAIIKSGSVAYGIYNYSNEGTTTWYGFAKQIFTDNGVTINLLPIPTAQFPTPAKRPEYSVLSKEKIKNAFGLTIKPWEDALKSTHGLRV